MPIEVAPDDIVPTHAEAERNDRPPLLVLDPLRAFLDEHCLGSGELAAEPVGDGHSNVTYLVRRDDREVVVRRPPRPPLPPSAHDVLREARLLTALRGTAARVPEVLAVCDDESVIGAPFYVMERVAGDVITTEVPAALDTPEERRRIGDELADIGYLCATWSEADDPPVGRFELGRVTRAEGFPTRAGLVARYEARSGRAVGDLRWYTTLALWKSVVFMEGNYRRAVEGRTDDPYLKSFGDGVLELAARAEAVAFGPE